MSQSLLVSLGNATVSYLICILHNYFLIAPTAVQECRDRALLNQSDFTGLAGVGCEEGFEVHSLDDSREEEGHVKLSNPRPDAAIPTPSRPAEPASISSSKSKPSPKFKVPPHVKFGPPGPPKVGKKSATPASNAIAVDVAHSTALEQMPGSSVPPSSGINLCVSRGPTPPISRPSTPAEDDILSAVSANPALPIQGQSQSLI